MKRLSKVNKKGVLDNVASLMISLATIAVIIAVMFLILAETGEQATNIDGASNYSVCTSSACNSTKTTQGAMSQIPDWLSIIVIVVIGGIIIGLVKVFRRS